MDEIIKQLKADIDKAFREFEYKARLKQMFKIISLTGGYIQVANTLGKEMDRLKEEFGYSEPNENNQ